jgi:hypothetical protein
MRKKLRPVNAGPKRIDLTGHPVERRAAAIARIAWLREKHEGPQEDS